MRQGPFGRIAGVRQGKNANMQYDFAVAIGDKGSALKIKELEVSDDFSQIVCGC